MAIYRLKSKLYGEFDGEKKKDGILGTGITLGQAVGTLALAKVGMKGYNKFQNNQFKNNLNTIANRQNMIAKSGINGAKGLANQYGKNQLRGLMQG